ncbi:response regulator [Paenibacillus sp. SYP-B3998]|uniref:histidine kinase n=2 Tax=Paenibacillus sp. SYP-B3998 TaxID=2678564 RepID=A0A6G3ZYZ2_9BACL|nr:response regulator [Paenibacillus sp. SYP-B3998]
MSKTKILLITGLFLVLLTGLRILWNSTHEAPVHPQAINGILDLRSWDLPNDETIPLEGQWEFYPSLFLNPNMRDRPSSSDAGRSFIQAPDRRAMILLNDKSNPYTFGTYRLRILMNTNMQQSYGLRVSDIQTASELFVNGKSVGSSGHPSEDAAQFKARNNPYYGTFITDHNEIEIVIHVSNDSYIGTGGIVGPIRFGTESAINQKKFFSIGSQLMVCIVLLLHAFYAILLFFLGTRQKALIYFTLLIIFTITTVIVDDDRLLLVWVPLEFGGTLKVQFLSYTGAAAFIILFAKHMVPEYGKIKAFSWFVYFCILFSLFVLFSPTKYTVMTGYPFLLILLLPNLMIPIYMLRAALKKDPDAIYLLLGATGIANTTVWGLIKNIGSIELTYYPFDLIFAFLGFAGYWFKRFYRNTAETQSLADKLTKVDKLKDDFLANTSHELRNPLHGIISIAQNVLDSEKSTLDDKNKRNMELLIRVGRRMTLLLNDLLDLNRLRENEINLQVADLRIQSVAAGVVDMLRFMTEGKPIKLVMLIPAEFPSVLADENRLIQILFNLIHNAIKYTSEGDITVTAHVSADGKATIHIIDAGMGMDKETQVQIFERYEQGDSSMTAVGGGLGLGLSITKQLVELHGGTLQVKSTPDVGSVFSFTLPLFIPAEKQEEVAHEQDSSIVDVETAAAVDFSASNDLSERESESRLSFLGSTPRILAVDDDPLNLRILYTMLSVEQYDIVTVTSGREAIARIDTEHWDLIITDIMMPHMSGYELTRLIRERFSISELPILLLTARSRSEDIDAGFLSGANDYVMKPMDAMELRSRVRALTELKKSIGEQLRVEAAWLHAQIKPHFLFNTLNTISALGDIDGNRMRALLDVFGDYMRSNFDAHNLDRVVPLEREIELVRSYLYIEKERFDDRLQIVWEVDENIQIWLPPLTIQTLVENALNHGILKRASGGTVHIRISDLKECVEISIKDNGVGIGEDKLHGLLNNRPDKRRGIGLLNTDQRLKQIYGQGLLIQSTIGQGTTVSFKIPN